MYVVFTNDSLQVGQLAALAYPHVTVEPVVREPAAHNPTDTGLVCDLAVRGLWSSQTEALIDCRIVNTDAQSYAHQWRNWDDFNVDTSQKSSWGSGERCEPPSGVRGSVPEIFEIYGFFHLRGPILANFRKLFRCFVAEVQ